jgi:hypothetical protein
MSHKEAEQIAHQIERAPQTGDGQAHNLDHAYSQISELQRTEGFGSHQFRQDMATVNQELHQRGILPNVDIIGTNDQHQILTANTSSHELVAQNASHVSDQGAQAGHIQDAPALDAMARAWNIPVQQTADGGYVANNPFDNPQAAAAGIVGSFLSQLAGAGGGGDSSGNQAGKDGSADGTPPPAPLGMNSWEAQSFTGWNNQPATDDPTDGN